MGNGRACRFGSALAKVAGFVITAQELQKSQSEVSDEELEGVAGGSILGPLYDEDPDQAGLAEPKKGRKVARRQ